jgi:hypothetical protein
MITPFREKPNRIPVAAIPELEGARPPVAGVCSLCLFAASDQPGRAEPIALADLEFFEHGHPSLVADGMFQYPITLPKAGVFRVLGDYYPAGATPQLTSDTIIVPGTPPAPVQLTRDYADKPAKNLRGSFSTIPEQAVATARTQMRLSIDAKAGLERYLGAWAHMLVASNDLIDMMHEHPLLGDGGPQMEFEVVFPRPGVYRVWIQLQSDNTVNTVHFDVPVGVQANLEPVTESQ